MGKNQSVKLEKNIGAKLNDENYTTNCKNNQGKNSLVIIQNACWCSVKNTENHTKITTQKKSIGCKSLLKVYSASIQFKRQTPPTTHHSS